MKNKEHFSVVNLTQQEIPIITEDVKSRYAWVPVGIQDQDDFFQLVIDSYNTSTTHAACIEGLADLIYGKGLYSKNEEFDKVLSKLLPQEDVKRLAFDVKLFGNGALTVYWNDEHTKIKKFHHTPVQNWRAQKLHMTSKVEKYYYCQDWSDVRQHKNKVEVPAFGTSSEKMEVVWFKNYSPGKYYYSLPDWISSLQFAFVEAELSNLHLNNIENGFLPLVMLNMNNGVPAPEERQTIENLIESKFTGTRNAGRFMLSFNDDANAKPTVDIISIENLHEKYTYVAEYSQDRILVAHRITSPLLFGIRTTSNGFSSQSEEMLTAFSILQTMTINPLQNTFLSQLTDALIDGGWEDPNLYFDQLTPLAILSQQAEQNNQTVDEVAETTNEELINPETTDEANEVDNIDTETLI
jgi:capsid portal protein